MGENIRGLCTNDAANKCIASIRILSAQVGIPGDLKRLGVKPESFGEMVDNAMRDACALTNPRIATREQVIEIYRRAYVGQA